MTHAGDARMKMSVLEKPVGLMKMNSGSNSNDT